MNAAKENFVCVISSDSVFSVKLIYLVVVNTTRASVTVFSARLQNPDSKLKKVGPKKLKSKTPSWNAIVLNWNVGSTALDTNTDEHNWW